MSYDDAAQLNHSVLALAAAGLLTGASRAVSDLLIADAEPTIHQLIAAHFLAEEAFLQWVWLGKRGEWVAVPTPAGRRLLQVWDEEAKNVPMPKAGAL